MGKNNIANVKEMALDINEKMNNAKLAAAMNYDKKNYGVFEKKIEYKDPDIREIAKMNDVVNSKTPIKMELLERFKENLKKEQALEDENIKLGREYEVVDAKKPSFILLFIILIGWIIYAVKASKRNKRLAELSEQMLRNRNEGEGVVKQYVSIMADTDKMIEELVDELAKGYKNYLFFVENIPYIPGVLAMYYAHRGDKLSECVSQFALERTFNNLTARIASVEGVLGKILAENRVQTDALSRTAAAAERSAAANEAAATAAAVTAAASVATAASMASIASSMN